MEIEDNKNGLGKEIKIRQCEVRPLDVIDFLSVERIIKSQGNGGTLADQIIRSREANKKLYAVNQYLDGQASLRFKVGVLDEEVIAIGGYCIELSKLAYTLLGQNPSIEVHPLTAEILFCYADPTRDFDIHIQSVLDEIHMDFIERNIPAAVFIDHKNGEGIQSDYLIRNGYQVVFEGTLLTYKAHTTGTLIYNDFASDELLPVARFVAQDDSK